MARQDYDQILAFELNRERAKRKVKEILAAEEEGDLVEMLAEFTPALTFDAFLEETDEEAPWRIDGLAHIGSNTTLIASKKAGKTTMLLNLMRSLVDGVQFLNQPVTPLAGNVLYWQLELSAPMARDWIRRVNIKNRQRCFVHNLRGKPMPMWDERVVEHMINWLRVHEIECWVIDPMSVILRGWPGVIEPESSNGTVGRLQRTLEVIKNESGCTDLFVAVHTGHNGTDARGASIQGGWVDAEWKYVIEKMSGADDLRLFSAYGRDVDLEQHAVSMDKNTRRLELCGNTDALRLRSQAKSIVHNMKGKDAVAARDLRTLYKGVGNNFKQAAIEEALRLGWIIQEKGPKGAKLTRLNMENEEVREMVIEDPGEGWEGQ